MQHSRQASTATLVDVGRRALEWRDRGTRLVIEAAGVSHPGRRHSNQDQHLIADLAAARRRDVPPATGESAPAGGEAKAEEALLAVADGMGGHNSGEVASVLAVRVLMKEVLQTPERSGDPLVTLDRALRTSDDALHRAGTERTDFAKMGTTLTVAWFIAPMLYYAHVGDSRLYLLRQGQLTMLTRDHTLAADLNAVGHQCAKTSGIGHILTQAIGGGERGIDPAEGVERLEAGDLLLLCTDGLVRGLTDEDIARALSRADSPRSAASALLAAALATDDGDNITAVVARVQPAAPRAGATVARH